MFNFSGRAQRAEYWWFFLWQIILSIGLQVAFYGPLMRDPAFIAALGNEQQMQLYLMNRFGDSTQLAYTAGYIFAAFLLLSFLPNWSVTVRRLHDTGRSGWLILMPFVVSIVSGIGGGFLMAGAAAGGSATGALIALVAVGVVPMIAYVWFIVWLCLPSVHGTNRFGPDPLPDRPRPQPSHPAFAQEMSPAARADAEAARKVEAAEYYRTKVLPAIQGGPQTQ